MSETVKQRFDLVKDELVSVWCRTHYTVEAESLEEAVSKAENGDALYEDYEFLDETMVLLEPKENCGEATVEWFEDAQGAIDFKLIKTNA